MSERLNYHQHGRCLKNLKSLNVKNGVKFGQKVEAYLSYGIKTKGMNQELKAIIGTTDDVGAAIAKNLHTDKMKVFLAGSSAEAKLIRKNIAYALETSPKLKTNVLGSTQKFVTKVKPPKVTPKVTSSTAGYGAAGRNAGKKTVAWIAKTTGKGITKSLQTVKSLLGKMPAAIKWFSELGWVSKFLLLGGIWFAYDWVKGLFEAGKEKEPLSPEKAMKSAFTGALAYNSEGSDIVVSEAQASTFCDEVMGDHSRLIDIIQESCVTLQDISVISLQYFYKK